MTHPTPPPRSLPPSRVSLPAALDALYQLVTVCNTGHIRWKPGTRGEIMAREALHAARLVLLASEKYKRDPALLKE